MIGAMLLLLGWDSIAQFAFGLKFTVSWAIWEASINAPVIPYTTGYVHGFFSGHLFWSGFADAQKDKARMLALLVRASAIMDPPVTVSEGDLKKEIDSLIQEFKTDEG